MSHTKHRYYVYYQIPQYPVETFHKLIFASSEAEATLRFFNIKDVQQSTITKIVKSVFSKIEK